MTTMAVVDSMARLPLHVIRYPEKLMQELTIETTKGLGSGETTVCVQLFKEDRVKGTIAIPREFFFKKLLAGGWTYEDKTSLPMLDQPLEFQGELDPKRKQHEAVMKIINAFSQGKYGGILQARAGTGKTVMGLYILAAMGTRTIILVHSDFLMRQWRDRIRTFLGIEPGYIRRD